MAVEYKMQFHDNDDDVIDSMGPHFSTIEGECTKCKKARGSHTLIATRAKYLSRSTMKVWMNCIICNQESTLKCRIA